MQGHILFLEFLNHEYRQRVQNKRDVAPQKKKEERKRGKERNE